MKSWLPPLAFLAAAAAFGLAGGMAALAQDLPAPSPEKVTSATGAEVIANVWAPPGVDLVAPVQPDFNGWPYLFQESGDSAKALTALAAPASAAVATAAPASAAAPAPLAMPAPFVEMTPVPDTPQIRALYPPMSRGGQATAPLGN